MMKNLKTNALAEQKPIGVIDALAAGFSTTVRHPWVILIPILLDLAIWLLPRISLAPIVRQFLALWVAPPGLTADAVANFEQMKQTLGSAGEGLNLLGVVNLFLSQTLGVPSLLALDPPATGLVGAWAYNIPLNSVLLLIGLIVPLSLLALFVGALYLELIARVMRTEPANPRGSLGTNVALIWLRVMGFMLALFFGLLLTTPLWGGVALVSMLNPDIASFLTAALMVGGLWILIYLSFSVDAIVVSGVGVFEAMRRSVILYRTFFWASFSLLILTIVLNEGLGLVWQGFQVSDLGVATGILLNAFVGTGLVAASMIFYQDRFAQILKMRARAKPAKG
jgi:hypothetical protein